jgi:cytoskeletal protein CcmA (bactofilin family)
LPQETTTAKLGKSVRIVGQISSSQDLYVDGDLDGSIDAPGHTVTVGPDGSVRANIKAAIVVVIGKLQGNIDAGDKTEIRQNARLEGDVRTPSIVVEDGAYFKGGIDIVRQLAAS